MESVCDTAVCYVSKAEIVLRKIVLQRRTSCRDRILFTDNKNTSNRLEIRPFQGYRLAWPNRPRIRLQHYLRLEERFDTETGNWINTFGLRFRYQAELTLFFKKKKTESNKSWYFPVSIEFFADLIGVNQFNDLVRVTPGLGFVFSIKWRAQFDMSYHYTRNTTEDDFATSDFVFRIRVYHVLERKKSEPEDAE